MVNDVEPPHPIGWARAIVTGLVVSVVAIVLLVYVPNAVLKLHGKTHGSLVATATTIFFVMLFALAWALRRLQRRKLV